MELPHLHKLYLLEEPPYTPHRSFICNLCQELGYGAVYHCSRCDYDLHPHCAAMSERLAHASHEAHALVRRHMAPDGAVHTCDSCGLAARGVTYRCDACDFDAHATCARAPRFLSHPAHGSEGAAHGPLALVPVPCDEDPTPPRRQQQRQSPNSRRRSCNGCGQPILAPQMCYACTACKPAFILHQFCATLSTRTWHRDHPNHQLELVRSGINDAYDNNRHRLCDRCWDPILGWHFRCTQSCNFSLHPGCTNIVHEIESPPSSSSASSSSSSSASSSASSSSSSTSHAAPTHDSVDPRSLIRGFTEYVPTDNDVAAAENVLRFARSLVAAMQSGLRSAAVDDQPDACPICWNGFGELKPKKSTSCGHDFHLECLLEWMERSSLCPMCRGELEIML